MTSTRKAGRGKGIEICHLFVDSIVLKTQIYYSILWIEGAVDCKVCPLCETNKNMTSKSKPTVTIL